MHIKHNLSPMKQSLLVIFTLLLISCREQTPINKGIVLSEVKKNFEESIRGISIGNDKSVWFTGSRGYVSRLDDDKINIVSPEGYKDLDFRSIYSFNNNKAIIMSAGSPTIILKTTDGGITWNQTFVDSSEHAFYNAIAFWDNDRGIAIGDPVNQRFSILMTQDGGEHWVKLDTSNCPKAYENEAGFAASGTNMKVLNGHEVYYLTGGAKSRMLSSVDSGETWSSETLPIRQGKNSEGGYSFDINGNRDMMVVGGDYSEPYNELNNACLLKGQSWRKVESSPKGYRSCVQYMNDSTLVSVGISGMDISLNYGGNWSSVDTTYNLNVLKFVNDTVGYAAGKGVILKLTYKALK